MKKIEYYVMDPTGNVTILVTTEIPVELQPETALRLMALEPEAEQVGFVYLNPEGEADSLVQVGLRMAGGEFCGNASMSCAALYLLLTEETFPVPGKAYDVILRVSGANAPLHVKIQADSSGFMYGTVDMPAVERIESWEDQCTGHIVHMPGITHLITEQSLSDLQAEDLVRRYAYEYEADAVGLMQINKEDNTLKPLVFVDTADTLYWEHSCASGTSAAGAAMAKQCNMPICKTFSEPGGELQVEAWPEGRVRLSGKVRVVKKADAELPV